MLQYISAFKWGTVRPAVRRYHSIASGSDGNFPKKSTTDLSLVLGYKSSLSVNKDIPDWLLEVWTAKQSTEA